MFYLDLLKWLVKKGASLKNLYSNGDTCLVLACRKGRTSVAKWLLQNGCNITETNNKSKESCLYAAIKNGHLSTVKFLFKNGCSIKDVVTASHFGHKDIALN